jgi:hypothetical protein
MTAIGGSEVGRLLQQYGSLRAPSDKEKRALEASIVEQLRQTDLASLVSTLTPPARQTLDRLLAKKSFCKVLGDAGFQYAGGGVSGLLARSEAAPPASALRGRVEIETARIRGDLTAAAADSATPSAAQNIVRDGVASAQSFDQLRSLADAMSDTQLRRKLQAELDTTEGAVASVQGQTSTFQQILAYVEKQPNTLTPRERQAVDATLPTSNPARQAVVDSLAAQLASAKVGGPSRETITGAAAAVSRLGMAAANGDPPPPAVDPSTPAASPAAEKPPQSGILTREQAGKLNEPLKSQALTFLDHQESYNARNDAGFDELASLLRSNLPIETLLVLFMMLMSERFRDKMELKMEELLLAEKLEKRGSGASPLGKSASVLRQELQRATDEHRDMAQLLSGLMRTVNDMVMSVIHNSR